MSTMDLLVHEVESRFDMSSSKAGSLLTAILGFVQEQNGGLSGFIDRFRRVGLTDAVSGWLSGGPANAISGESVQNVLGAQAVNSIASRAGLSLVTASSALGFLIPKLVQSLTPGGNIPSRLPTEAMSYLSDVPGMVTARARDAATVVQQSSLHRWLWPLLAVVGALLLYAFWPKTASLNIEDQVRGATQKATSALAALRPGFAVPDLLNALNLEIFNFPTGSAQIPDYTLPFLDKAANAIKMAPAGTLIEIGGHTDNTGDAAANLALSQQRADAVRNYLMQQGVASSQLTARGYGDTQPIASNDNDEGRFRNRRIAFTAH